MAIRVAMVIPETGLLLVLMIPTMREDTVTKKKPKTMISTPSTRRAKIPDPGMKGRKAMISTRARLPPMVTVSGRSSSVRRVVAPARPALSAAMLLLKLLTMVGMVRSRVMNPPAATAPAPI